MSHNDFPAPDRIGVMTGDRSQPSGEPTRPQLQAAGATFDLLSAPTRLHLMWLLARSDYDVGTLAARTGATVALVSQHLAKLRLAGLVTARREGRRHIYAVEDPHVLTLIDQIFAHIAPDGSLAPDPPSPRRHPAETDRKIRGEDLTDRQRSSRRETPR
jgi:DNA-binding transcriptional ArsR family regulator